MVRTAVRGFRLVVFSLLLLCVAPMGAFADAPTGGATYAPPPPPPPDPSTVPLGQPQPIVPGVQAVLLPDGTAAAPADAPPQVQNAIWAANTIQTLPYKYGGGHKSFISRRGYDCSGTVSFALNAAALLKRPLDSSSFMRWGAKGPGRVVHGLHEPRSRVRRDRRPAARHELGRRRWRQGPALARQGPPVGGLQDPPPARLLERPSVRGQGRGARRSGRRPRARLPSANVNGGWVGSGCEPPRRHECPSSGRYAPSS